METDVKEGVNLSCVMEEENEAREFQGEELPLQRLQGVEGHGVMRPHQCLWSSWDLEYPGDEGQEPRSQDTKREAGPLLQTTPILMFNISHIITRIMISS